MLEDFKDSQDIAFRLISGLINNDKLSHAYLINGNFSDEALDFCLAFVKSIICNNHYVNNSNCGDCKICDRISHKSYPEFKIIETDSMVIKKDQLLELQSDFSLSSIEGKYLVYLIKDCDKMNKQSSNSLLKFLEEPPEGIIAILLTNNLSGVLPTIISRCQLIHLKNNFSFNYSKTLENFSFLVCQKRDEAILFQNDNSNHQFIDAIFNFIDYFEENGDDVLLFMKNMWYNIVTKREEALKAFSLWIYLYYDVLKYKLGFFSFFCADKVDLIEKISLNNSVSSIIYKINIIHYGHDMVKFNLNLNLLMDDIIIRLGDANECCRS